MEDLSGVGRETIQSEILSVISDIVRTRIGLVNGKRNVNRSIGIVVGKTLSKKNEIRRNVRATFYHELGHYFGLRHVFTKKDSPSYNRECNSSAAKLTTRQIYTLFKKSKRANLSSAEQNRVNAFCDCFVDSQIRLLDDDGLRSQVLDTQFIWYMEGKKRGQREVFRRDFTKFCSVAPEFSRLDPVSYTHLTLPTICSV